MVSNDKLSRNPVSLTLPASKYTEELMVARVTAFVPKLEGLGV